MDCLQSATQHKKIKLKCKKLFFVRLAAIRCHSYSRRVKSKGNSCWTVSNISQDTLSRHTHIPGLSLLIPNGHTVISCTVRYAIMQPEVMESSQKTWVVQPNVK